MDEGGDEGRESKKRIPVPSANSSSSVRKSERTIPIRAAPVGSSLSTLQNNASSTAHIDVNYPVASFGHTALPPPQTPRETRNTEQSRHNSAHQPQLQAPPEIQENAQPQALPQRIENPSPKSTPPKPKEGNRHKSQNVNVRNRTKINPHINPHNSNRTSKRD